MAFDLSNTLIRTGRLASFRQDNDNGTARKGSRRRSFWVCVFFSFFSYAMPHTMYLFPMKTLTTWNKPIGFCMATVIDPDIRTWHSIMDFPGLLAGAMWLGSFFGDAATERLFAHGLVALTTLFPCGARLHGAGGLRKTIGPPGRGPGCFVV